MRQVHESLFESINRVRQSRIASSGARRPAPHVLRWHDIDSLDCEPDDIANFTNRSPYPTLHLLRESSIDRAVAAFPEAETIFERNIETMERLGHEGWKKLWLS